MRRYVSNVLVLFLVLISTGYNLYAGDVSINTIYLFEVPGSRDYIMVTLPRPANLMTGGLITPAVQYNVGIYLGQPGSMVRKTISSIQLRPAGPTTREGSSTYWTTVLLKGGEKIEIPPYINGFTEATLSSTGITTKLTSVPTDDTTIMRRGFNTFDPQASAKPLAELNRKLIIENAHQFKVERAYSSGNLTVFLASYNDKSATRDWYIGNIRDRVFYKMRSSGSTSEVGGGNFKLSGNFTTERRGPFKDVLLRVNNDEASVYLQPTRNSVRETVNLSQNVDIRTSVQTAIQRYTVALETLPSERAAFTGPCRRMKTL